MIQNVSAEQQIPRIAIAAAASVGAAMVPRTWAKTGLFAVAAGLLASVATGYCPITAALNGANPDAPDWRTLKSFRVEA
jgi:DUF2892 family protein